MLETIIAVVLISGSYRDSRAPLSSAEIWSPTGLTCNIADMKKGRKFHVQFTNGDVVTVCGHDNTCETLKEGQWRVSHTLQQRIIRSSVWNTDDGAYIMGGSDEPISTTKIGDNRSVDPGFQLKYKTR